MSFALLRKELREHGGVVVVTCLLGAAMLFAMLAQAEQSLGGRFVGLARFSLLFGVLIPLVFSNRLLVREYSGRTQLFLETLPIGRARAFATKWLLGCALTLTAAGLSWLATLRAIRRTEVLSWQDAQGTLLAFMTFWFTLWCFSAMAAMLGRYRYAVWAVALLLLFVLDTVAGIPIFEAPVLRLLGPEVQMARGIPEMSAFFVAMAVASISIAGAATLALWGSGAMASTLARRMTARERVFVLVGLISVLTVSSMLERKPEQPPFEITDGERIEGRFANLGVMATADFDVAAARHLARTVARDLDTLIEALALEIRPSVFILPQQGLDRETIERASMHSAEGIVLRIAPDAPRDTVRAVVGHSLLIDATHTRALREDRHVLLDGLTSFWALRDDPHGQEKWRLRAATIARPLSADDLTDWDRTSEVLGECVSLGLSFSVFEVLVEDLGLESALDLMRRLFRAPPGDDARAVLERRPRALLAAAGTDWQRLARQTETALQSARERHRAALSARPPVTAHIDWQRSPERGIEIETRLAGTERYSVYYRQLGPWTASVARMPRLDVRGARAVLPLASNPGDRVLVVIEVEDPLLDCRTRVAAERLELG